MNHQQTIIPAFNKVNMIVIGMFMLLAFTKASSQIQITEDVTRTYNFYRTWAKGEKSGSFSKLDWQVRFVFSENTIKKYWEKDGLPTSKWVLQSEYDIEKSEKRAGDNGVMYMYITKNKMQIGCNPYGTNDNIIIIDGSRITEYINYH